MEYNARTIHSATSMNNHFRRAEGFYELGMYSEAWSETEDLPPIDRTEPLVLELKLRIATALSLWDLGEGMANVLPFSAIEPDKCKETTARFHHARARVLCQKGELEEARKAMREASDVWPEIRIELVDDKELERALWGD